MDADRDAIREELDQLRRELRLLRDEQCRHDERLAALLEHPLARALRAVMDAASAARGWTGQKLLRSRLHPLHRADHRYAEWSEWERAATAAAAAARAPSQRPRFSVLMPVRKPRRDWLVSAVDSVIAQSYTDWELCVCDDASGEPWIADFFAGRATLDARIRFAALEQRSGASAALNRAACLSSGEYLALLDQEDALSPFALQLFAAAAAATRADLLYSDEEATDTAGRPLRPVLKPRWSPELLGSSMYLGRLLAVSRPAFERAGGFRTEFDRAQDFDLALRVSETAARVEHVPHVLYRRRALARPGAHEAGRRALEDAVRRRRWSASVLDGPLPATYHIRHRPAPAALASILICSRRPRLLARCLSAIERRTQYAKREIVVVEHRAQSSPAFDALAAQHRYRRLVHAAAFDFAAMNNAAAGAAEGDVLVFLNDDVLPLAPEWLEAMAGQAMRPEVGAVGALLFYPSGAIQHAGVVGGMVYGAGHPLRRSFSPLAHPYWPWGPLARNASAVTGACMAVRKQLFQELGGFDPAFPVNYNDVDFCFRALTAGYRNVVEPAARLRHDESRSRAAPAHYSERELLWRRWADLLAHGDPYWNPHLSLASEIPSLRVGP